MKKKIIMIVACVMCCAGLFGGCGQSGMKQDNTAISNSEEGKQEGTTEEKEVTGTIDEIKDFMFEMRMIHHIALLLRKSRKDWRMSATEIL